MNENIIEWTTCLLCGVEYSGVCLLCAANPRVQAFWAYVRGESDDLTFVGIEDGYDPDAEDLT